MRTTISGKPAYFGTGSGALTLDKKTILFVHGAGFDHSVWVMPARYFARHGFNVIAVDLPAHGRSEGPALESVEAMADWLAALVTQDGQGPVAAVGHSMGSLVVGALANQHPALVDKIALLGTSDPMAVGPPLLDAALDDHPAAYAMANTWSHSAKGRLGGAQNPGLSNFVSGGRWLERMTQGTYYADLMACNNFQLSWHKLEVDALVIAATEDKMTPIRSGMAVAASLVNGRIITLQGSGHAMLSEHPNEVLDALAGFIDV